MAVSCSLQTVSQFWGADKVEHYDWARKGSGFCNNLRSAARAVRDWSEAVVKLNRLILRRINQVGRRPVLATGGSIQADDLMNLKAWTHKHSYVKKNDKEGIELPFCRLMAAELPSGFGLDEFGLLIRTEQWVAAVTGDPTAGPSLEVPPRSSVETVRRIWGAEKVEHYGWAEKGAYFCSKLYAAAREVRDWDEAVVKLNRLILRRTAQVGRPQVLVSVNSIISDDLVNLKAWGGVDPYIKTNDSERKVLHFRRLDGVEVPAGFGFDIFGLMVRMEEPATVADDTGPRSKEGLEAMRKRPLTSDDDGTRPKRARTSNRAEKSVEEQAEQLGSVLAWLGDEFAEREWLSQEHRWCTPIPTDRKISTVQSFYKAFHDVRTLPIETCMVCYRKYGRAELDDISWGQWAAGFDGLQESSPFQCRTCFPMQKKVPSCADCLSHMRRGVLPPAAQIHIRLGCEHVYPDELKGLTPVEEKLIALNSCYGFITKYSLPGERSQTVRYPKHVKGHITVFPNNVQELATNVLPHPLLKVMDEIHVSWQGLEKPAPKDLSSLLSVRRRVVERALAWLKRNNPLYAGIHIDTAEMDRWSNPVHGVLPQIYDRLERNEPSGGEKARTGQLAPAAERGLEEDGPVDIREIMAELREGNGSHLGSGEMVEGDRGAGGGEAADDGFETIHEISASGMFPLDAPPDIWDGEKLQSVCQSLGRGGGPWDSGVANGRSPGSALARHIHTQEPYIAVSRVTDFANSLDPRFFAKTFPSLFPFGSGGPCRAEESIAEAGEGQATSLEREIAARRLVSTRNMSLATWTRVVLRRHGGRFATHHIFAFLVFNMGVRSRNRRVSMLSVSRKEFPRVERIVHSLTKERLEKAKTELETSTRTTDDGVNQLLKSLSLYGFRQPMSRESRMSMRRKIKSLIIRYGIPAIWFMLNPNDITNPVKLRLAAHRFRGPDEAEAFLASLDLAYKRTKLAVSDPLSSAIFFHREISLFFEHYVKVGQDSVFGRVSQYFGAVETNERGALHLHGLLWLQGNLHLSTILQDVQKEGQTAYRDQIIEYVDSVFTEVSFSPSQQANLSPPPFCTGLFSNEVDDVGSRPRSVSDRPGREIRYVGYLFAVAEQ